jgi:hypothetical protein
MRLFSLPSLFFALSAAPAAAQSINVDFQPVNAPNGPPPASYGAAAQSPGVWNAVASNSAANLVAANGTSTTVALATTASSPTFFDSYDYANTSGADQALLDDYHRPDEFFFSWVFTGLAPGEYDVYTIHVQHGNAVWIEVTVPGSPDGTRNVWGSWNGSYVEGTNYTRHHVTVTNGTVSIDVQVVGLPDYAYLSGLQLVTNDTVGLQQCFGDGSGTSCPCGNNGLSGHGCGNSVNSSGALLVASGTTSPDTIVLHSSGETPTALSIFLQGDATIGPVVYGDGLRCAGGILKRLYAKAAAGGAVFAPAPGDPAITVRSAALGNPIQPGERRYYQVYFRDANPGFCPPPQGSTFNITNGLRVVW